MSDTSSIEADSRSGVGKALVKFFKDGNLDHVDWGNVGLSCGLTGYRIDNTYGSDQIVSDNGLLTINPEAVISLRYEGKSVHLNLATILSFAMQYCLTNQKIAEDVMSNDGRKLIT